MNEQISNTNAAFMEVTSREVEAQDRKIAALEEQIKNVGDIGQRLQKLLTAVENVSISMNSSTFPVEKMADFSSLLDTNIRLLKQPLQNKIFHHHHFPKITWIVAGLFLAFALVCSSWYITGSKLEQYIANDTKYRKLKLDTSQRNLQSYLDRTDSLYKTLPNMRENVLEIEEKFRLNFERLQKAERLKAEAKDLEKSARER